VIKYDPETTPNPDHWLQMDEQERILLVEEQHRLAHVKPPNLHAHAAFHAIIENQIALNLEPVVRAIARLTREGLSRHDAIHAISSIMAEHIHELFNSNDDASTSQSRYIAAIERLTAKSWLKNS
jgi:hypothetical protein